jgi:hypothetical protein
MDPAKGQAELRAGRETALPGIMVKYLKDDQIRVTDGQKGGQIFDLE